MSFAPLSRPAQFQVKLDQTPNQPQSDGFNWPTFRLLNKQARVTLSPDFLDPLNVRRVLTTANTNGGWFAATTSRGLIVSPLSELRAAFQSGSDAVFSPKRTLPCNPVAVAFAFNDTRLLAGTEQGQILAFDTAQLISSAVQVEPLQVFQGSSSPAAQILPNPSSENELAQLVVIVRVDGTVQMLNSQMESRGAWAGTDFESTPVAASWSPKGKQVAVGLRSGDILTFGLNNNALPLKHIPATAASPLVSVHWVGPAFTFRTSYGSGTTDPPHHIVSLDTRSNTAAFIQLAHPFPLADRSQNAQVLVLHRWDQDSGASADDAKNLIVVGDTSSTDLEVLGSAGSRWYQQSQENQLSVPLDKNDQDTFLLTVDLDLTDELPIMYGYLNDGTVQAWYITHPDSKPYAGLVGAGASPSAPAFGQQASGSAFGQPQQPTTSAPAFGQSSGFGQSSTSAFAQPQSTSPFGQSQTTSAFGQSAFAQKPAFGQSAFGGQSSTPSSAFGSSNTTSAFGSSATPSAFGSSTSGGFSAFASTPSAFGVSNNPPTAPPLNSTPSVSMGEAAPSFGGLSLGSSNSGSDNKSKAVGGGMFGSPSPLPLPPNHPANQPTTPTPSTFSDPALIKPATGFGAFGAAGSGAFGASKPSAFGGGAFSGGAFGGGNNGSSDPKPAATSSTAAPAFGKTGFGQTGFGQSGFGQTSFGQKPASAFGQSGFASAAPATPSPSGGGFSAFASAGPTGFANAASSTFGGGNTGGSPSAAPTAAPATGGFGAFSSASPTAFGQAATTSPFGGGTGGSFGGGTSPSPSSASAFGGGGASPSPASAFGGGNASPSPASAFGGGSASPSALGGGGTSPSPFGGSASTPNPVASAFSGFATPGNSLFGNKTPQPSPAAQPNSRSSSPDSAKDEGSPSPPDSPPPSGKPPLKFTTTSPPTTTGAFGNLKSSSTGFKPASGFGAFGSDTTPSSSPFFNAASQPKTPPVSAFGSSNSSAPATPTPAAAAGKPAFGAPSQLGGLKSAFSPVSPASTPPKTQAPVSGGFGAFVSSPVSLTSSAAPAKSFGELLKSGDEAAEKPKPVSAFAGSGTQPKPASPASSPSPAPTPIKPVPVFTPPPKEEEPAVKESEPKDKDQATPTDEGKEQSLSGESSFGQLSQASSFVEIAGADADEDADGEAEDGDEEDDEPGDDDDGDSFLSESFGSGSEAPPDDDDGEDDSRSPSPSAVPLPPSRSPSSTPVPKIQVSSSPTPSDDGESDSSEESRLSTIREESTTPPGSPEKKASPPAKTPLAAPVPVVPSPFGLGLGRPSTRPTRSSPLANASTSGDEDKDQTEKISLKPRPASPKPVFGALPPQLKTESSEERTAPAKPARPKTPPLSALSFGSPAPKPPLNIGKVPLAGAPLPAVTTPKASPVSPSFSPAATPKAAPATPGSFFGFGTPKSTPSPTPATPVPAPKGFFEIQSPASSFKPPTPTPVAPPPEATMEEGMQKECAMLFANMTRELEDFRSLAQAANQKRLALSKSAGGSRRTVDLGNRTKWALADAVQFGQTMRLYEQDLADLKEERAQKEQALRELRSNLLKAGTRREEIGRFLKAQHDNDFAKMLKARTLGPEHLETQTHLRRSIRAMQDRIQKLESHLQESKKRLSRANSGNPGLRAPTLDTLNRTFRNMDIALDNQTGDVEKLAARVAKLNMKTGQRNSRAPGARDARLPDPVTRQRPFNVTPHVAVTTAAALNAERSAHKLKRALLTVRKEPLLNTQAASAPPAPLAFKTPQRSGVGLGLGLVGPSTPTRGAPAMPGFDFPEEDNFNPSPPPAVRRGAGGSGKTRLSNSVPLKRSPGYATSAPSPPPSFDWGPLPSFQKKATPVSPENSLGGSWIADGFGSK
ncbi:hypothetical protein DFH06DRAFT_121173 [Mycena polygramma]|nr:hypothetical protein DFH06DRAFT_121173 [Mycena polygramma]